MFDLGLIFRKQKTLAEMTAGLTKADLYRLTHEVIDELRLIVAEATDDDVVFVPVDPAKDPATEDTTGWTLAHLAAHTTASSEDAAESALVLARGVTLLPELRLRYEVPEESIKTVAAMVQRLEESRRMRVAMLDAWPDEPHLDNVLEHPRLGAATAISRFIMGIAHEQGQTEQYREVMRQAITARNPVGI